ncbi:hypothetical protein [Gudongella sp. DL1XJH-153]|uniref:hypothetical protein n=1 Tax=Gudongella sp. DL1XJH-153 TaxID=3409804 RepID=UPI003BB53E04
MKGHKKIEMANFNCTFGDKDEPMLTHFKDIMYPALKSSKRRIEKDGNQYFIEELRVYNTQDLGVILVGLHILKTQLEVKSIYEEGVGLKSIDRKHDSGPYSAFIIILKNHRMIHIRNQKGSPSIKSFAKTIRFLIQDYVKSENSHRSDKEKLPQAFINVTNIPSPESIDDQFRKINKIKLVTFRLYPLNGEIEVVDIFNGFRDQLATAESKSGNMNINNPKNKQEVSSIIKEAGDRVDTTLKTILEDGTEKTFKNNDFSEKIPVYLSEHEDDIHKNILNALDYVRNRNELFSASELNQEIYSESRDSLVDFIREISKKK